MSISAKHACWSEASQQEIHASEIRFPNGIRRQRSTLLVWAVLLLANAYATDRAYAQPADSAVLDVVPAMDGKSLEGLVVEEGDVAVDELGRASVDSLPSAKAAEPLPADVEARLDALSAERETMAEAVAQEPPLLLPPLDDPDAPPRMDARVRNPDRLRTADEAAAEAPGVALEPVIPTDGSVAE